MGDFGIDQDLLNSINVEQCRNQNKQRLDEIGGVIALASRIGVDVERGLSDSQVQKQREMFGTNAMPESPQTGFFSLLLDALSETILLILIAAAAVSLAIGLYEDPKNGYVEGAAIFIAVFLVSNIQAFNDYSKELKFRELEASSANDQRASVLRNGVVELINPADLVVGDIICLQAGDMVPADCAIIDHHVMRANESALTGEPDDLRKSVDKDCFLLSSTLVTEGDGCKALVFGIGLNSQWGKIKANLVTDAENTPLQDKLDDMAQQIGYVGMIAALGTFIAKVVNIWAHGDHPSPDEIGAGFIEAFILAVTIVVVAIPEGLPLAVTISLAYSSKKMYKDNCFIRQLAACETMGNATNICSDKTGTLTENRMTVIEGWYADTLFNADDFNDVATLLSSNVKDIIADHVAVNRTAYLVKNEKFKEGTDVSPFTIVGNKTEGALIFMIQKWGVDHEHLKNTLFNDERDKVFSFDSKKKRSTSIVHLPNGTVRLFCKGASEVLLQDCAYYLNSRGEVVPMDHEKRIFLNTVITDMASRALRTLVLAHKNFASAAELPEDWRENPPDSHSLCCDCIVGIMDPVRSDVKEAVATAQRAGVFVRMVTGDNVVTASAIAKQCGILTEGGIVLEGPVFRKMTPKQIDEVLPYLQVLARSSPDDKYLLVTRLNGHGIPANKEEWDERHKDKPGVSWETHKDLLLPGYREEWEATRPEGGEIVGVTGDGTNDAPALKAADVGLAMGITGTKVAQGAADVVLLDDKFSSIVKAILWGRTVFDNIRRFLQFQLTVNVVALLLVFIGACADIISPLNAVQMLWVNLVMDTMGALALGTETPTPDLLNRRPYKRSATLISRPMLRNIIVQGTYQLLLLLLLMFEAPEWFGLREGVGCLKYDIDTGSSARWNSTSGALSFNTSLPYSVSCQDFKDECGDHHQMNCYENNAYAFRTRGGEMKSWKFSGLPDFEKECLSQCIKKDYTHGTVVFNTFIFCQFFNEYTSRKLFNEWNILSGLQNNAMFFYVSLVTAGLQVMLVQVGGDYLRTTPLRVELWFICIALGFIGIPLGFLMRLIPVKEDPDVFFISGFADGGKPPGIDPYSEASDNQEVQSAPAPEASSKRPSIVGLPIARRRSSEIAGRERSASDLSDVSVLQIEETAAAGVQDDIPVPPVVHVVPIKKSYEYFDVPSYYRSRSNSNLGSGERAVPEMIPHKGSYTMRPEGLEHRAGSFCGDNEALKPDGDRDGSGSIELHRVSSSGERSHHVIPAMHRAVGELSRNDSGSDGDGGGRS